MGRLWLYAGQWCLNSSPGKVVCVNSFSKESSPLKSRDPKAYKRQCICRNLNIGLSRTLPCLSSSHWQISTMMLVSCKRYLIYSIKTANKLSFIYSYSARTLVSSLGLLQQTICPQCFPAIEMSGDIRNVLTQFNRHEETDWPRNTIHFKMYPHDDRQNTCPLPLLYMCCSPSQTFIEVLEE